RPELHRCARCLGGAREEAVSRRAAAGDFDIDRAAPLGSFACLTGVAKMRFGLACIVMLVAASSRAEPQASTTSSQRKPTISLADAAKWESLGAGGLSPDGKWVTYDIRRNNGTNELHYRAIDGDDHAVRSANGGQFTSDNRWLVFTITPDTAGGGGRGARGGRGGANNAAGGTANHNKVAAIDLRSGTQTTF